MRGRRRHVEPFAGANPFRIVHQHEGRGPVPRALHAGGPVRLVAQHQVEWGGAVVLGALHQAERVIGAEHSRHRIGRCVAQGRADRRRVSGDRNLQLLKRGVLVVAPRPGIRADADIAVRHRTLLRPLPHRLLEQQNRRHQIEHPPANAGHRLGDAERGEGLAGAAGHDELAAVVLDEARRSCRRTRTADVVSGDRARHARTAPPVPDELGPASRRDGSQGRRSGAPCIRGRGR